jgi:hypothetical protein
MVVGGSFDAYIDPLLAPILYKEGLEIAEEATR